MSSACGGHGICGLCCLRVLEGASENLTQSELIHLDIVEQNNNFRLAGQV